MKTPPLEEAKELAGIISIHCDLIDIILIDQWRRERNLDEWRLSYLGNRLAKCPNNCEACPVYKTVGGNDDPKDTRELITTLVLATNSDLQNYEGNQHCLNCKSLDQYTASFVNCFIGECDTKEKMLDELDYVVGFKVVYWCEGSNPDSLEEKMKSKIIAECLARYPPENQKIFIAAINELDSLKKYLNQQSLPKV